MGMLGIWVAASIPARRDWGWFMAWANRGAYRSDLCAIPKPSLRCGLRLPPGHFAWKEGRHPGAPGCLRESRGAVGAGER